MHGTIDKILSYTGMDKTRLYTSSTTLFVREGGREDVHVTSDVNTYHCSA